MPQASDLPAWAELQTHRDTVGKDFVLKEQFAKHPKRFDKYTRVFTLPDRVSSCPGDTEILFDFSMNFLTDETLDLLVKLAADAKVEQKRDALIRGDKINFT